MKSGSWASIISIYAFGVVAVAGLSKMMPLLADFHRALGATPGQFAFLISLLALPTALFAAIGGAVVDRVGARRGLIFSGLIGITANTLYLFADSVASFQTIRILEGLTIMGVFTSAPALLMATTSGERRVAAMTLWSTYTPIGISTGLLLASVFAGSDHWRWTFVAHGALFALVVLVGLWLPKPAADQAKIARPSLAGLLAIYTDSGPVRLSLGFGLVVCIGLGISVVLPTYFAHRFSIPVGTASRLLAGANFAMLIGAYLSNRCFGLGKRYFLSLAAVGVGAGIVLFALPLPLPGAVTALAICLAAGGGGTSFLLATLPGVVADPRRGAAAAGLLGQISSITTFLTPPFWIFLYGHGGWAAFVAMIAGGWCLSFLLMPAVAWRTAALRGKVA